MTDDDGRDYANTEAVRPRAVRRPDAIVLSQRVDKTMASKIDPETETTVRRFLARIADRHDIAGAIVYGSRARGTHRPDSDADVAVLLRGEPGRFLTVKLDMADTAFDVSLETGILVSPLPVWTSAWGYPDRHSNPDLLRTIEREGVWL